MKRGPQVPYELRFLGAKDEHYAMDAGRLTRQFARCDSGTITDRFAQTMANIESAFLLAGARPLKDYGFAEIISVSTQIFLSDSSNASLALVLEDKAGAFKK